MLENLVNNHLNGFLDVYSILSGMQSGFRSGYGCDTATLKVLNDVTIALDSIGVSEGSLNTLREVISRPVYSQNICSLSHCLSQRKYPRAQS